MGPLAFRRAHGWVVLLFALLVGVLGGAASCTTPQRAFLDITPSFGVLVSGQTAQLVVTRRFPGGPMEVITDQVGYFISGPGVATISPKGLLTAGVGPGPVVIRISDPSTDAIGTASFTVSAARIESIDVTPGPSLVMSAGTSQRLTATAHLSDGTIKDVTGQVTWASSNEGVATVGRTPNELGLATALTEGQATISATDPSTNVVGRTNVVVQQAAELKALVVTPNPALIAAAQPLQFTALGFFADGSMKDLTSSVAWSSSNEAVATVDAQGLATGVSAGDTTITAVSGAEPDAGAAPKQVRASAAAKVQ
jgi:hypothetical protein